MLEDPAYSEVVRWGDQGDSFVVLEVCSLAITHCFRHLSVVDMLIIFSAERKVHQDDIAETLQAQ